MYRYNINNYNSMSYLMNSFGLGFKETRKKFPFTTEQLITTKDKLTKVNEESINQWSNPLRSKSWKYLKKWIKANPREFTEPQLVKFKNVILDPDFPSIRQKFHLNLNSNKEEPVNWIELCRSFMIIAAYFVGINVVAASLDVYFGL